MKKKTNINVNKTDQSNTKYKNYSISYPNEKSFKYNKDIALKRNKEGIVTLFFFWDLLKTRKFISSQRCKEQLR